MVQSRLYGSRFTWRYIVLWRRGWRGWRGWHPCCGGLQLRSRLCGKWRCSKNSCGHGRNLCRDRRLRHRLHNGLSRCGRCQRCSRRRRIGRERRRRRQVVDGVWAHWQRDQSCAWMWHGKGHRRLGCLLSRSHSWKGQRCRCRDRCRSCSGSCALSQRYSRPWLQLRLRLRLRLWNSSLCRSRSRSSR
eukprot:COSAG03_NODE_1185_length_4624_cov_42.204952_2_plen_188_part_00